MKFAEGNILKNGNIGCVGKRGINKLTKAQQLIGEENLKAIVEDEVKAALYDDDKNIRSASRKFLMGKFYPNPPPEQTYIKDINLLPMRTMENIKHNEDIVLKKMCEGDISMEIGERLFSLIEQARKTWECTEAVRLHEEMKQMVEDIKGR